MGTAKELGKAAARVAWFAAMVLEWSWLARQQLRPGAAAAWILGGMLLTFPVVEVARRLLDRQPTPEHAARVTTVLHAILLILLGNAIVEAVSTGAHWRGWELPVPQPVTLFVLWVTGIVALASVLNLAVSGLGVERTVAWITGRPHIREMIPFPRMIYRLYP